jgi:hypothetical protein
MFRWADTKALEEKPVPQPPDPRHQMIKWFAYEHLPPHLQVVSVKFAELAAWMTQNIGRGQEATEAMRCLLQAKDAAVRAFLDTHPTALKDPPPNV